MADDTTPVQPAADSAPAPVAPPAAPAITPPADQKAEAVSLAVRTWQTTELSNTAVSRTPDCWAVVDSALPALIASILAEV